jgi:uncharacterized integral membrane protein
MQTKRCIEGGVLSAVAAITVLCMFLTILFIATQYYTYFAYGWNLTTLLVIFGSAFLLGSEGGILIGSLVTVVVILIYHKKHQEDE